MYEKRIRVIEEVGGFIYKFDVILTVHRR